MRNISTIILLLSSLLAITPVSADVIHFKNGNSLEGVVKEEREADIIVDVGGGQVSFSREEIDHIEKETAKKNESYFQENEKDEAAFKISREMNVILSRVRRKRLLVQKKKSVYNDIAHDLLALADERAELHREMRDAKASIEMIPVIKGHVSNQNYKRLKVKRKTFADARRSVEAKEQEIKVKERERAILAQAFSQALTDVAGDVEKLDAYYKENAPEGGELSPQLKHIKKTLDWFESVVTFTHVPVRRAGGNFIADVKLNGKVTVPLLVDTGASTICISEQIAEDLQIKDEDVIQTVKTRVADGRLVEGKLIYLDEVDLAGFTQTNVRAIILPRDKEDEIVGLLGMSFLNNYIFKMDIHNSALIFETLGTDK